MSLSTHLTSETVKLRSHKAGVKEGRVTEAFQSTETVDHFDNEEIADQ